MRNIKIHMLIAILTCFCFSCKDDDNPRGGSFVLDEKQYALSRALTEPYPGDGDYHTWYLSLSSKGLKFDESIGYYSGKGELVIAWLYSYGFNRDELPEGVYVWPTVSSKSFVSNLEVVVGYESPGEHDEYFSVFSEAFFIVERKDKGNYEIEFSLTTSGTNKKITGAYTGPVEITEIALPY